MPPFVDIGLVSPPVSIGLVSLGDELRDSSGRGATVVGGEDKYGAASNALIVQLPHDLAHHPVSFHDEVAILSEGRFALPLL